MGSIPALPLRNPVISGKLLGLSVPQLQNMRHVDANRTWLIEVWKGESTKEMLLSYNCSNNYNYSRSLASTSLIITIKLYITVYNDNY